MTAAEFTVGSLVSARGREWVIQPESDLESKLLVLRPLGGAEDEVTGISLHLEPDVRPATFPPPVAEQLGNHRSGRLLRDAVRLGFRSGAGPFRSLAHVGVDPRPYQLVPLLMALRLDPVRLLIADDVGVGKTVEALLIARELLDRAEIRRIAVLCPPHLAEQWREAMVEQFQLDATLVLKETARRLERGLGLDETIFDRYPITVISTDFIKSQRRRETFLNHCPEFVIVDEAHTCADPGRARSGQQQRHQLLRGLTANATRHLLLVTATPYSGNDTAFRSLLALLNPEFKDMPLDLTGDENDAWRQRLARHVVLRRRADVERYLDAETPFPKREEAEETYRLHSDHRKLFTDILRYARQRVTEDGLEARHRRIRWWSVLALLRALGSSPAAVVATLKKRAAPATAESIAEVDEIGRRSVLDLDDASHEGIDIVPGSDAADAGGEANAERRRLQQFTKQAQALMGKDAKLKKIVTIVRKLVKEGHRPILFCRFLHTVDYVVVELRKKLKRDKAVVMGVTGRDPAAVRAEKVAALGAEERPVLVCTDCLSEGINLQDHFDTVIHYDLSWNPTRHEQREGRVDRYRQRRPIVRALTYWGTNSPIDGIVLEVLLRKHKQIRKALGISVPAPAETGAVMNAILEGVVLREDQTSGTQLALPFANRKLDIQWQAVADREKTSRSRFAQHALQPQEVAAELAAARRVLGDAQVARRFLAAALPDLGATLRAENDVTTAHIAGLPDALRASLPTKAPLRFTFRESAPRDALLLGRSHPVVSAVAAHVLETSLDGVTEGVARRCAMVRTRAVPQTTTMVLTRLRFHLHVTDYASRGRRRTRQLLAEDCALLAFTGTVREPVLLDEDAALALLDAEPDGNVPASMARRMLRLTLSGLPALADPLAAIARERATRLSAAHDRVRKAARRTGQRTKVTAHLPVDVLGIYVLLPPISL